MSNNCIYHHGQGYVEEHGQGQFPAVDKGNDDTYGHVAYDGYKVAQILSHACAYLFHITVSKLVR